jgi:hypothetical protein
MELGPPGWMGGWSGRIMLESRTTGGTMSGRREQGGEDMAMGSRL